MVTVTYCKFTTRQQRHFQTTGCDKNIVNKVSTKNISENWLEYDLYATLNPWQGLWIGIELKGPLTKFQGTLDLKGYIQKGTI